MAGASVYRWGGLVPGRQVRFSIHTYQVALNSLAPSDLAALSALGVTQHATSVSAHQGRDHRALEQR